MISLFAAKKKGGKKSRGYLTEFLILKDNIVITVKAETVLLVDI